MNDEKPDCVLVFLDDRTAWIPIAVIEQARKNAQRAYDAVYAQTLKGHGVPVSEVKESHL